jgi:hypothetical protein
MQSLSAASTPSTSSRGSASARDAAAHRRLVAQLDTFRRGELRELWPVPGEHALVGGDHRLALLQGCGDDRARRLLAADQLHHQVDVVRARHRHRVGGELLARERPRPREIAHRRALEHQARAGRAREHVPPLEERARHRIPDRPYAQEADSNRLHAGESTNLRQRGPNSLRNSSSGAYKGRRCPARFP